MTEATKNFRDFYLHLYSRPSAWRFAQDAIEYVSQLAGEYDVNHERATRIIDSITRQRRFTLIHAWMIHRAELENERFEIAEQEETS